MNLQARIALLRKQAGLSQEQLAEQLGVSRQSVSKWESGASVPELDKIILLSDAFGVSLDWLLKDAAQSGRENAAQYGKKRLFTPLLLASLVLWVTGIFLIVLFFLAPVFPADWLLAAALCCPIAGILLFCMDCYSRKSK